MTIYYATPIVPNGSTRQYLHYLSNAYLSPFNLPVDTISNSITYNNHQYHLLDRKYVRCSLVSTALKIISYCTIILPIIAGIVMYSTKDLSKSFFLKEKYSYKDIKHDLNSNSTNLKILHQLMPNLLENTVEGALVNCDTQAISLIAERDPESLSKASLSSLHHAVISAKCHQLHDILNPLYLKHDLNNYIGSAISEIFANNNKLWLTLTTTQSPQNYLNISTSSEKLIHQVYGVINTCLREGKEVPNFHPKVFTLTNTHKTSSIPSIAFLHGNIDLLAYLLENYKNSVITKGNIEIIHSQMHNKKPVDCKDCPEHNHPEGNKLLEHQKQAFILLIKKTKGALFDFSNVYAKLNFKNALLDPSFSSVHEILNPIYLNRASIFHLSTLDQSMIFNNNQSLWLSLLTTCDIKTLSYDWDRNQLAKQVYTKIESCLNTNAPVPNFHASIFSYKNAFNYSIPITAFIHGNKKLFSWMLRAYPNIVTSDDHLRTFCQKVTSRFQDDCDLSFQNCTEKYSMGLISENRIELFKTLIHHTKGGIYRCLTESHLSNMRYSKDYANLYTYLISDKNPFPLPDHLRTPTTTNSSKNAFTNFSWANLFHSFVFGGSNIQDSTSTPSSSKPSSTTPPRSESPKQTPLEAFIQKLYKITGLDSNTHPCKTKKAVNKLYKIAAVKVHPDKNHDNGDVMTLLNQEYQLVQETTAFIDLPNI